MVSYNFQKKMRAKEFAKKRRKMGYECALYPKEKGYGVSVTKK